jgi:hypothetical protein
VQKAKAGPKKARSLQKEFVRREEGSLAGRKTPACSFRSGCGAKGRQGAKNNPQGAKISHARVATSNPGRNGNYPRRFDADLRRMLVLADRLNHARRRAQEDQAFDKSTHFGEATVAKTL